jgi:PPP family 3-phenylpropionic acid transporter
MMADPTGFWLWPIQGLHALTFAMAHLGAIAFISRAVPDRGSAAAQGATGAMAVGGVMALQMALAAAVYPRLGGGTYAIGVVSSALGLVFCLWLARRWQGQVLAV